MGLLLILVLRGLPAACLRLLFVCGFVDLVYLSWLVVICCFVVCSLLMVCFWFLWVCSFEFVFVDCYLGFGFVVCRGTVFSGLRLVVLVDLIVC